MMEVCEIELKANLLQAQILKTPIMLSEWDVFSFDYGLVRVWTLSSSLRRNGRVFSDRKWAFEEICKGFFWINCANIDETNGFWRKLFMRYFFALLNFLESIAYRMCWIFLEAEQCFCCFSWNYQTCNHFFLLRSSVRFATKSTEMVL